MALCNVTISACSQYGQPLEGAEIWAISVPNILFEENSLVSSETTRYQTENGSVVIPLIRLNKYRINIYYNSVTKTYIYNVPDLEESIASPNT
jgi:hypothetical protein